MYIQDLYTILYALWVDDTKAIYSQIWVQLSLIFLLSSTTSIRPEALVESGNARGSNKALLYEYIIVMKIYNTIDREQSTVIIGVNLVHIKNSEEKSR